MSVEGRISSGESAKDSGEGAADLRGRPAPIRASQVDYSQPPGDEENSVFGANLESGFLQHASEPGS